VRLDAGDVEGRLTRISAVRRCGCGLKGLDLGSSGLIRWSRSRFGKLLQFRSRGRHWQLRQCADEPRRPAKQREQQQYDRYRQAKHGVGPRALAPRAAGNFRAYERLFPVDRKAPSRSGAPQAEIRGLPLFRNRKAMRNPAANPPTCAM
jgi:hypothetical protein